MKKIILITMILCCISTIFAAPVGGTGSGREEWNTRDGGITCVLSVNVENDGTVYMTAIPGHMFFGTEGTFWTGRDVPALTVRAFSTQTTNIHEWDTFGGFCLAAIGPTGKMLAFSGLRGGTDPNVTIVSKQGNLTQEGTAVASLQGLELKTVTITNADYTALATDVIILFSAGATTRTLTLPSAGTFAAGKIYIIKKIDLGAGKVTIDPDGSETVDGDLTPQILTRYESWTISSDGSNWHVH